MQCFNYLKILLIQFMFIFQILCLSNTVHAQENFLSVKEAFVFDARSISTQQVEVTWQIAPDYYLYKYQFSVQQQQKKLTLQLPPAQPKQDEFFGDTEVYYQNVGFTIEVLPEQTYTVSYQGCAEKGLCYPLAHVEIQTDVDGLLILKDAANPVKKFLWNNSSNDGDLKNIPTVLNEKQDKPLDPNSSKTIAADQAWSAQLHERSLFWSILVFLGLGCLLAFTPCSLPMLPILSSLLIRKHQGVKAIFISLTFVISMALVYALLGSIAASMGSGFQRWLQQPLFLIAFSIIFIVFALNLFGVFELKMPQSWVNRLDGLQANQRGGTLIGAGALGVLSALLVGPCMTAPLAGTLLYISQSQNVWMGAILLFSLGLGMGLPLLALTLLGQKALPKPGLWMNYVRHIFAFMMLGLSLYFVRPLLSENVFNLGLLIIVLCMIGYLTWLIYHERKYIRYFSILAIILLISGTTWQSVQYWHYQQQNQHWQVVTTATELEHLLLTAQNQQQAAVIDVYADWCIACQPLEREVWAHPQVQIALDSVMRIKLDLSDYHPEQQKILEDWQLIGPPTALFIDAQGQEQRNLRLTGTFQRESLMNAINELP